MVEAPEKIWSKASSAYGMVTTYAIKSPDEYLVGHTEYVRADIAERQIAELRAERDKANAWAKEQHAEADRYAARVAATEAENARLSEALREYENPTNWGVNARFDANSSRFDGTSFAHSVLAAISGSDVRPALPLKDERHLTLDEQKTFDDALRNSGTVRQVLPLKDEVERVLNESRRHVSENLIRMYGHDGFGEIRRIDALLSRLRAGEQEG